MLIRLLSLHPNNTPLTIETAIADDDSDDNGSVHENAQHAPQTVCANGASDTGVNVWIVMDDMPAGRLGSMALSPGSHKAAWHHDACHAIGQDRNQTGGMANMEAYLSQQ
jgi:hypothetical protein